MIPKQCGRKLMVGLLSSLAALSLMLSAAVPAFAAEGTPTPNGERRTQRLERLYQRALHWLDGQADNLSLAGEVAARIQEFIDKARGEGKDTSALEAALASFNAKVAEAQGKHDEAATILNTHTGFDADGKVTDPQQAQETLVAAGRALRGAHRLLVDARIELRRAIHDFRQANRPAPAQTPQP